LRLKSIGHFYTASQQAVRFWALWRATSYLFSGELWPFVLFWLGFAAGLIIARPQSSFENG